MSSGSVAVIGIDLERAAVSEQPRPWTSGDAGDLAHARPDGVAASRREHIATTAMTLFLEHGFEAVTVDDIADAASVGRATVFRYFGEKAEIVFADASELESVLTDAATNTANALAPIGGDLRTALRVCRAGLLALADYCTEHADHIRVMDTLTASHETLQTARAAKERRYIDQLRQILTDNGTNESTAALTGHLAIAVYTFARERAEGDPAGLGVAIDEALTQLL